MAYNLLLCKSANGNQKSLTKQTKKLYLGEKISDLQFKSCKFYKSLIFVLILNGGYDKINLH